MDSNPSTEEHETIQNEPTESKKEEADEEKGEKGEEGTEQPKTNTSEKAEQPTSKKTNKSVTYGDTQICITENEDGVVESEDVENSKAEAKVSSNPRITISEPVCSPCESESAQKKPQTKGRCPIYYGIKSYIHDFYQPPDKDVFKSGEYTQEDDFQFLVEPGKRRWRGCWLRTGLWVGINLMLLGVIAMLVGHLTPPRETIVGQQDNFTILDRWAVTFNNRLIICQLAGLAGFTSGAIIVMLALLVSSYQQEQISAYYVMAATVVPETFVGNPLAEPRQGWGTHRIPLTGSVKGVQPIFGHNQH